MLVLFNPRTDLKQNLDDGSPGPKDPDTFNFVHKWFFPSSYFLLKYHKSCCSNTLRLDSCLRFSIFVFILTATEAVRPIKTEDNSEPTPNS